MGVAGSGVSAGSDLTIVPDEPRFGGFDLGKSSGGKSAMRFVTASRTSSVKPSDEYRAYSSSTSSKNSSGTYASSAKTTESG